MSGKQAVAFVLDASPSMNAPYPSKSPSKSNSKPGSTRFSCAKSAIEDMISDLIIRSKMNEAIAVVVNAPGGSGATRHHLCCDEQVRDGTAPFPGILSLNGIAGIVEDDDGDGDGEYRGMAKPNVSLLRQLRRLEIGDATDEDIEDDHSSDGQSSGSETENDFDEDDGSSPPPRKRRRRGRRRRTRRLANFCDGVVVAADAIHRRTSGKKFVRRLVLFTDAANEISMHPGHVQTVVDGLVRLGCTLEVIGLDFDDDAEASFELPASQLEEKKPDVSEVAPGSDNGEEESSSDREDGDDVGRGSSGSDGDATDDDGDGEGESSEEEEDDDEEPDPARVKSENEKFLISLARLTGGSVTPASTLKQVLRKTAGKRTPKSSRTKMLFAIAPDLEVRARFSLLTSRANLPTLSKAVVLVDERNEPLRDGLGEERTSEVQNNTTHWDAYDADREVEIHERTDAYRYGSDLIPMGGYDIEGLKMRGPKRMTILGYTSRNEVPRSLFVGTPYAVTGEVDSSRSCVAVSALARAMDDMGQVAVCSFVKGQDADPIMGALFPVILPTERKTTTKREGKSEHEEKPAASSTEHSPLGLFFVQMPFADDVSRITMRPLDDDDDRQGAGADSSSLRNEVADDLVDSLMLPDDALRSDEVPNPSIRCVYRTLARRAVEGGGGIVEVRRPCRQRKVSTDDSAAMDAVGRDDDGDEAEEEEEDPMSTPGWVVERARGCIERFKETFPVVKERHGRGDGRGGGGGKRKKKRKYWSDIV